MTTHISNDNVVPLPPCDSCGGEAVAAASGHGVISICASCALERMPGLIALAVRRQGITSDVTRAVVKAKVAAVMDTYFTAETIGEMPLRFTVVHHQTKLVIS